MAPILRPQRDHVSRAECHLAFAASSCLANAILPLMG
jgi:hypothetical protein